MKGRHETCTYKNRAHNKIRVRVRLHVLRQQDHYHVQSMLQVWWWKCQDVEKTAVLSGQNS